jgi:hypothetical protein
MTDITGKGRLHAPEGEWLDAHSAFSGGDGKVTRSEAELTDTSWNDVNWDDIKEASARALLESETGVIDPDVKEKYPLFSHVNRYLHIHSLPYFDVWVI